MSDVDPTASDPKAEGLDMDFAPGGTGEAGSEESAQCSNKDACFTRTPIAKLARPNGERRTRPYGGAPTVLLLERLPSSRLTRGREGGIPPRKLSANVNMLIAAPHQERPKRGSGRCEREAVGRRQTALPSFEMGAGQSRGGKLLVVMIVHDITEAAGRPLGKRAA